MKYIILTTTLLLSVLSQPDPNINIPKNDGTIDNGVDQNGNQVGNLNNKPFCDQFPQLEIGDGTQNRQGQCSLTIQGAVPSFDQMVSTMITSPGNGEVVDPNTDFTISVDTQNLQTGFFSDAQNLYYVQGQGLNADGIIFGHQHVTVQAMDANNLQAADPRVFSFFKGLNDVAGDGRTLSVVVPAGTLKNDGLYRICSITGSHTHQPVIMPVAQRGSQDDCIRIEVKAGGAGNQADQQNNDQQNNDQQNNDQQNNDQQNNDQQNNDQQNNDQQNNDQQNNDQQNNDQQNNDQQNNDQQNNDQQNNDQQNNDQQNNDQQNNDQQNNDGNGQFGGFRRRSLRKNLNQRRRR
ncbi:hypothetical protein HK099_008592 [Clydaea vesicula]|uniref:Uncharacterized protein n=1 Tax=Clydaea vesicula TaxID=447962 RepID=A0AAD5TVA6_9FUNG|nr:hypothetical protein HK099_008592 [Clydaea vesicula]